MVVTIATAVTFVLGASTLAQAPITALAITPDGQQLVVGSQAGISVLNSADRSAVESIATTLDHVHDLQFSPDGKSLLVAGGSPGESGSVELYAWPRGQRAQVFKLAEDLIYRVQWSGDGNQWAAVGQTGLCTVIDRTSKHQRPYAGHSRPVLSVAPLPRSSQWISAGADATIQLWTDQGVRVRTLNNHTASVTDLTITSDRSGTALELVSTSEDRTVRLWQPEIGRMVRFLRLETIPRRVISLTEHRLAVASDDGHVYLIDSQEMKILNTLSTQIQPVYELVQHENLLLVGGPGGLEALKLP